MPLRFVMALMLVAGSALAENRIDGQRPDAPELASYGPHTVGVRTLELSNPGQIDIVSIDPSAPRPDPVAGL